MNKRDLSEADICAKFITPAVIAAGWDEYTQLRREVHFTKGQIHVRGKLVTRGKSKFADYVLYYKPNIPIAIIEAKDNAHAVGEGMQQALEYAETLNIPFVFSSNGDGFLFHDRTGGSDRVGRSAMSLGEGAVRFGKQAIDRGVGDDRRHARGSLRRSCQAGNQGQPRSAERVPYSGSESKIAMLLWNFEQCGGSAP